MCILIYPSIYPSILHSKSPISGSYCYQCETAIEMIPPILHGLNLDVSMVVPLFPSPPFPLNLPYPSISALSPLSLHHFPLFLSSIPLVNPFL